MIPHRAEDEYVNLSHHKNLKTRTRSPNFEECNGQFVRQVSWSATLLQLSQLAVYLSSCATGARLKHRLAEEVFGSRAVQLVLPGWDTLTGKFQVPKLYSRVGSRWIPRDVRTGNSDL